MSDTRYRIEIMEHDGQPWSLPGLFTKAGAWRRIRMAASKIVAGWPYPVWARIYHVEPDASEVLVYTCDITRMPCAK